MSDPGVNENKEAVGEEQETAPVMQSPGAQLAALRQARGWSIEQVAGQLNLAPRQIQALENDDYPALPGMPIVRGFIRAYAKVLKVDSTPLLAAIPGETVIVQEQSAPRRVLSTPFSEARLPSITDRRGWTGMKLAAVLVVALLAGVWFVQQAGGLASFSGSLSSDVEKKAEQAPVAAAMQPEVVNPDVTDPALAAGAPADSTTAAQISEPAVPATPAPAPEISVPATPSQDAIVPAAEPAITGKDTLVLKAREDSWVEIKRSDNSILISRIVKAGLTESLTIDGPVSVVIGNAAGVEATLRGNPLELKANTSNNVARLSLK